jgi:hypothetical protein
MESKMKFALVAYLILNGDIHAFTLDEHLTYDDCQAAIMGGVKSADIVPGLSVDLSRAPLVCEIEAAPSAIVAYGG